MNIFLIVPSRTEVRRSHMVKTLFFADIHACQNISKHCQNTPEKKILKSSLF